MDARAAGEAGTAASVAEDAAALPEAAASSASPLSSAWRAASLQLRRELGGLSAGRHPLEGSTAAPARKATHRCCLRRSLVARSVAPILALVSGVWLRPRCASAILKRWPAWGNHSA